MNRTGARVLAVSLATLLGACTLEPRYQRPVPPVPALDDGARGGSLAAEIGWREFFPDLQLQQLIAQALDGNRDLRVAALNVQAAQAQYRIQRAELFPTVDATAVESAERIPPGTAAASAAGGATGPTGSTGAGGAALGAPSGVGTTAYTIHSYNVGIGFTSYELDFFGRIRSLNHVALEQYLSSAETRRSVQLTLVAEVANAYLTVLADETLLNITRDTLKSQTESYDLTKRMFNAGTTTELSLRQAEQTVDTARANLSQYNRQLAQDIQALQLLLGAPVPASIDFSGGLDRGSIVAELREGIPSDVLLRRPDVLASEHQLQAANAQIGAARAAFLPAVSLTGNFGSASSQLSGLFKGDSRTWTFSPQISLPIFAGGANVANLQSAKVARDTAVAQYEKTIQTAFQEVANALAARGTLDDQMAAQQELVTASEKAYHLSDMRFRGGVDTYLNALDAQRTLYSAQQGLQSVRLTRLQNLVTLYKALGGGLLEQKSPGTSMAPAAYRLSPGPADSFASN